MTPVSDKLQHDCETPVSDKQHDCETPVSDKLQHDCVTPVSDKQHDCVTPVSDKQHDCVTPVSDKLQHDCETAELHSNNIQFEFIHGHQLCILLVGISSTARMLNVYLAKVHVETGPDSIAQNL